MNNSIIKLLITLVTFSSILFVDSHSIYKRSPSIEGVLIGPDTPVYYVECPFDDCLVLNRSVNQFEASSSYKYYRSAEYKLNDTFFPKILVVLDWDNRKENKGQGILDEVLTKWDEIDKYFEQLDDPKMKLAIAGIIIPTKPDIWGTTDPRKTISELGSKYTATSVLNNVTKWLIDNSDHFGSLNYDFLIFLSRWQFTDSEDSENVYGNYIVMTFNCDTKYGSHYRPVGVTSYIEFSDLRFVYDIGSMLGTQVDYYLGCEIGHLMSSNYNINATESECSKRKTELKVNNSTYGCLNQIP